LGCFRWLNLGNFAFLSLMHYLDKSAGSALDSFRPLLTAHRGGRRSSTEDETGFERLSYRLTTLPARPVLAGTFVGVVFSLLSGPCSSCSPVPRGLIVSVPVTTPRGVQALLDRWPWLPPAKGLAWRSKLA